MTKQERIKFELDWWMKRNDELEKEWKLYLDRYPLIHDKHKI